MALLAGADAGTVAPVTFELTGVVTKVRTVGYLSPFRLDVSDAESRKRWDDAAGLGPSTGPMELELRSGNDDVWMSFPAHVGKTCRVTGSYVFVPSSRGTPGSEASTRFVGGMIPAMEYFEVTRIDRL